MAQSPHPPSRAAFAPGSLPRRRFLVTAASGLGAVLLASCGGPSSPTAQPSDSSKPAANPTAPAKSDSAQTPAKTGSSPSAPATSSGAVELNWFLPLSAAPEIKLWENFVERFQQANPNVVVKGSYEPWDQYWTKLQTVMAGGAIPDVIWLHMTRVAEWASKDVMKPLDDLLAAEKIDPKEFVVIDGYKYKGKLYALPKDHGVRAMYYNIDMFQKAGVALPTKDMSWDKFLEAVKVLTVDQAGKTSTESGFDPTKIAVWGTNMLETTPRGTTFYVWYTSMGGKLYDDEMQQILIDQPDSVAALTWAAELRTKHHVAPLPGAITEPGDPFRIEKVAISFGHQSMSFFLKEEKRTFKWDETYLPQGKGGLVIGSGSTGFAIPKGSKHPDEAWTVTKFMTGEEQQRIIVDDRRWAAGRTKVVPDQYSPDYHTENYKMVHVDPMTGVGPQAIASPPAPPTLAEIEQAWNSAFDPVWLGNTQVKDVVADLKLKIDELLRKPTTI